MATVEVGPANGTIVHTDDTRLADARAPLAHTHPQSEVVGLTAALASMVGQPAIGNVSTGAMVLLTDVITRSSALTATLNTLLAELRAAGILAA